MNQTISNRQIFAFISLALVGLTVVSLPSTMAINAGTGAWFTLLLSTLFFLIPTAILATLNRKFPGMTLFEYSERLVGKPLSVVFAVMYAVYFLGIFSFVARGAAEIIKADFLYRTPLKVTMLVLVLTSLYATSRGMTNLGRILELVLVFLLPTFFFLHLLMFAGGDKYNLLPLYNPSKTMTYLKAIPITAPAFLGFETLAVLPFHQNNLRLGRRYAMGGVVLAGILYILVVESCFSILGLPDIINYYDALVVAIRHIDAPYLEILRRVDFIFLVGWLASILCTLNIFNYGFHSIACSLFPRAGKWPVMAVVGAVAFSLGCWPESYGTNMKYFNTFLFAMAPFTSLGVPVLLMIMTRIRKDVVPKNS